MVLLQFFSFCMESLQRFFLEYIYCLVWKLFICSSKDLFSFFITSLILHNQLVMPHAVSKYTNPFNRTWKLMDKWQEKGGFNYNLALIKFSSNDKRISQALKARLPFPCMAWLFFTLIKIASICENAYLKYSWS